jgi:hypothetical protein
VIPPFLPFARNAATPPGSLFDSAGGHEAAHLTGHVARELAM